MDTTKRAAWNCPAATETDFLAELFALTDEQGAAFEREAAERSAAYKAAQEAERLRLLGGVVVRKPNCKRCGGTGFIAAYGHYQGGRCFGCTVMAQRAV